MSDVVVDDWANMARKFFDKHHPLGTWCIVEEMDGTFGIAFDVDSDPVITCPDMETAAVLLGCLLVSKDALATMVSNSEDDDKESWLN